VEDYRDQHLHSDPPELSGVPSLLIALVEECLYKAAGARPTPANVARRLEGVGSMPKSEGLARLQEANSQEVLRRAESSRQESESRSVAEMRQELADSAGRTFMRIGDALRGAILSSAPSTAPEPTRSRGWALRLNRASLALSAQVQTSANPWHWEAPSLDVVCHADLTLTIPEDHYQYAGRSHSLWFCDAQAADEYAWYETAFMLSPLIPRRARRDPFALEPGEEAAKALLMGMAEYQVAWPFTRLSVGEVDEFIDRWAGWFADAADGALTHPSTMPERQPQGSWRTS
jgi:serine/threonine-protein kinase